VGRRIATLAAKEIWQWRQAREQRPSKKFAMLINCVLASTNALQPRNMLLALVSLSPLVNS
jgi:hypothetical protein